MAWLAASGAQKVAIPNLRGLVQGLAYAPDGKTIAFGTEGVIRLIDPSTGKERGQLKGDAGAVGNIHVLAYSRDGATLASLAGDGVRLWSAHGQLRRHIPRPEKASLLTLALAADAKTFATGSFDFFAKNENDKYTISLWDAGNGKQRADLRGHQGNIHALAFSMDGKLLASAGDDGYLKLWDVASGKFRADLLEGECGAVYCLAFSPDGQLLAAGCYDRTINLWETKKLPAAKAP